MSKAGKVWGETKALIRTPFFEAHELWVNRNSFCSTHRHEMRYNAFYVLEGMLCIEVRQSAYNLVDRTVLLSGDVMEVAPGLYHRFYTEEIEARCLEFYYPAPMSAADITRLDTGGRSP